MSAPHHPPAPKAVPTPAQDSSPETLEGELSVPAKGFALAVIIFGVLFLTIVMALAGVKPLVAIGTGGGVLVLASMSGALAAIGRFAVRSGLKAGSLGAAVGAGLLVLVGVGLTLQAVYGKGDIDPRTPAQVVASATFWARWGFYGSLIAAATTWLAGLGAALLKGGIPLWERIVRGALAKAGALALVFAGWQLVTWANPAPPVTYQPKSEISAPAREEAPAASQRTVQQNRTAVEAHRASESSSVAPTAPAPTPVAAPQPATNTSKPAACSRSVYAKAYPDVCR